jgi:ubiquinone biosynthesis protein COQ4
MPRRRPLEAAAALRRLVANPEDTAQVFVIMRALSGDALSKGHARFAKTPLGAAVLREERDLLDALCDREALRRLPEGSLGRVYLAFVEANGIAAEGLVEASEPTADDYTELTPSEGHYARRLRDQHDLWHVLTGYSTQPYGEVCVVAFSYPQTANLGFAAIALIGALKIAKESGSRQVFRDAWEAYRRGRRARWLPEQDWEALLARPIAQVRAELAIEPRPQPQPESLVARAA